MWRMPTTIVVLLLLLLGPAGSGQAAAPPGPSAPSRPLDLSGEYAYIGGPGEIARLDRAIEGVVGRMNFIVRGFARSRLRKPNLPTPQLRIVTRDGMVTISRHGRTSLTTPADGRRVPWTSTDGDHFIVTQRLEPGRLTQRFESGDGVSQNVYVLGADGRLQINTYIQHRRLPIPLVFQTTYRRR
jgi:hypothetical protein